MTLKSLLRAVLRAFWSLALLALVALAVMLQLGRLILPEIHQYRPEAEVLLSRLADADVRIGRLEGRWRGMRPHITASNLVVSQDGYRVLGAARADLEMNALVALFNWQDGLRQLAFHQLYTTVTQREGGAWGIKHLRQRGPSGPLEWRDPLDLFLTGRRIALTETSIELEFRNGATTQVRIPEITLENDVGFHRLAALARVDGAPVLKLILEGRGDPRHSSSFDGRGYLALQALPTGQALESLAALERYRRLPASLRAGLESGGRVSTELWFKFGRGRGLIWQGDVNLALSPIALGEATLPRGLEAQLSGRYRGGALDAQFDQVTLAMPAAPPPFSLALASGADGSRLARARDIDLARWREALLNNGWLSGIWREWVEGLAPAGMVRRVAANLPAEGAWQLALEAEQAQVQAFNGVPALSGISGQVELHARGGRAWVKSSSGSSFSLPGLYDQPLEFSQVSGPLSWTITPGWDRLGLEVGPLSLANADLNGMLRLALDVPLSSGAEVPPALTLTVGIPEVQAQLYPRYIPAVLPDPARRWLLGASPEGRLSQLGLVFRGQLRPGGQRHLQLAFDFANLGLQFAPDWPRIGDANGSFSLRDESVSAVGTATLLGLRADAVRLDIDPDGPRLNLTGTAVGRAEDALALIRSSPLRQPLAALSDWRGEGAVRGELELSLPLTEPMEPEVALTLQLEQVALSLPGELNVRQVNGRLDYGPAGLASDTLRGHLLGRDFQARFYAAGDGTEMRFSGGATAAALSDWLERPELTALSGEAAVTGQLLIPTGRGRAPVLRFTSDLVGITAALPAPFGKDAATAQPLVAEVTLAEPRETRMRVADLANLVLVQADGQLQGLALGLLGSEPRYKPGIINFSGNLPASDLEAWQEVFERYRVAGNLGGGSTGNGSTGNGGSAPLPVRANLMLEGLQLGPLPLDGVNVSAASRPDGWLLRFNHPHLKGTAHVRDAADAPIRLNLTRLALPASAAPAAAPEHAAGAAPNGFKPEQLPPLEISIDELSFGKRVLGEWRGQLRPVPNGVYGYGITGRGPSFELKGRGEPAAAFLWLQGPAGEFSYFEGQLAARNLGTTLADFGFPRILESETGALDLELTWPGGPTAIGLDRLRGTAGIELNRGRFIRGASAGENPLLKLIGLLNFDTLARRLRLDFSDLHPEGMAFEKVVGPLAFRAGELWVDQPLLLESPSANLRLAGQIDLQRQRVDAQLVATLPVGGSLTAAAALTGGLPLAAGVWFASKLLQEPMDRFSSFRYHVVGPWSDPKIKLDRMFEDQMDTGAIR